MGYLNPKAADEVDKFLDIKSLEGMSGTNGRISNSLTQLLWACGVSSTRAFRDPKSSNYMVYFNEPQGSEPYVSVIEGDVVVVCKDTLTLRQHHIVGCIQEFCKLNDIRFIF